MQTALEMFNDDDDFDSYGKREEIKVKSTPKPSTVKKTEESRVEGAVRNLRQDRGFGFIAGDDGVDYFLHWSGMEKSTKDFRSLELLDRVSFVPIQGPKGPKAIMVRVI